MSSRSKDLGDRVAAGHAIEKHLSEFADLGIYSPEQLSEHVANITDSQETLCFTAFTTEQTWRQADIFYHEPTNTLVIDPLDNQHEPTTLRPEDGVERFDKKLEEATRIEGRDIEVSYGMSELYPEADKNSHFEAAILSTDSSPYAAQDSPQTLEEYLQQRENLSPEPLDYTREELPRTFEEYLRQCEENLEPEHTLTKDQEQDLER